MMTYSISCMILLTYTQWLSASCLKSQFRHYGKIHLMSKMEILGLKDTYCVKKGPVFLVFFRVKHVIAVIKEKITNQLFMKR